MNIHKNKIWILMIALLTATVSGGIVAKGGLVYLDPTFAGGSNEINNPWWPLISDQRLVHIEETDDECIVSVLEIRETEKPGTNIRRSLMGSTCVKSGIVSLSMT